MLANQALSYLVSGKVPTRIGNAHPIIVPYQVFPVADGHVIIASGNDAQFVKLCNALGAPELGDNPAYKNNTGRLMHRDELVAKIARDHQTHEARRPAQPAGSGAGAGRTDQQSRPGVRRPAGDPPQHAAQIAERSRQGGTIPGVRTPIMIGGWKAASERPSPRLGEHTAEILKEIGEG